MLNTVYRLVAPRRFEAEFTDLSVNDNIVFVRPTHLSICAADQRYYQGKRDPNILKKKLPMSLIHEGVGDVIFDLKGEFEIGQSVAMVPNTPVENDPIIAENYLRSSKFRASGFDGFMQDIVAIERNRIVCLPDDIDKNVAAFTELVSVTYHTINRFIEKSNSRRNTIGIWGDGNLGFITALVLKKRLPKAKVLVFGIDEVKLSDFVFVDQIYDVTEVPEDLLVDHAFECVGGPASASAIDQIIDHINPEGSIGLMGVSEERVPVNSRMILEKGLTLFGSSRSGVEDFRDTIEFYKENEDVPEYLKNIIDDIIEIRSMNDIIHAFESDIGKKGGKTVMVWKK